MSLSINKFSLRNVAYGVITWSCSLCGSPGASNLCRARPQISARTFDFVAISWHIVRIDLYLLTGLMVWVRTWCGLYKTWGLLIPSTWIPLNNKEIKVFILVSFKEHCPVLGESISVFLHFSVNLDNELKLECDCQTTVFLVQLFISFGTILKLFSFNHCYWSLQQENMRQLAMRSQKALLFNVSPMCHIIMPLDKILICVLASKDRIANVYNGHRFQDLLLVLMIQS